MCLVGENTNKGYDEEDMLGVGGKGLLKIVTDDDPPKAEAVIVAKSAAADGGKHDG